MIFANGEHSRCELPPDCLRFVFELLMTGVTNFNGISLVLLQLLKMVEQRRVELRIMRLNFLRDDSRFNLHFRRHHFQNLHK